MFLTMVESYSVEPEALKPKKRNIIELGNLHAIVEQKTANIIASLPYLDIYSLWWVLQHINECGKAYNNDYKSKKEYVKYINSSVKKF
jgi:hypothetical protein